MLVRIDYKLSNDGGYSREVMERVLGTGAKVGLHVGDLLTMEHPPIYGDESHVVSVTLSVFPDPEALDGR